MNISGMNHLQVSFASGATTGPVTQTADGTRLIQELDISGRQGYREDYSIRDAAESLWKQETQTFNLKDMDDPEKANAFLQNLRLQARWDLGLAQGPGETKEEVMSQYIEGLRQNGLDGSVNWSGLARELNAFKTTTPEELEDGLDYLASRYAAVLDKLERNYEGDELAAQRAKLEEVYQAGKTGMIDGYTTLLQENLGVSDSGAQAVRDSFSTLLEERVDAYRGALEKVHEDVAGTGADSVWLKNHDAYIASRLRASKTEGQSAAQYSAKDLSAAGQIAQLYQKELSGASFCGRNEATLGLNLAMADMKAEAMISKGLVSRDMAALLRNSRAQGHENVLNALDKALADRESTRAPGEPRGTFAPVDREVFQGIYQTVMSAYRQNGGDAAKAIQAGVSYGQKATAQATAKNPKALRWSVSIDQYWKDFYQTPAATAWDRQVEKLLIQSGQTPARKVSAYQRYVNDWQDFLSALNGGSLLNVQA